MRANPKLAGFLVILFAAALLTMTGRDFYRDWEFEKSPERSTATIDRFWTTFGNKGGIHYHAAYHYTINGASYQASQVQIASSTYSQLNVGQQVPIRYLSQDYTETQIDWDTERNWHLRNDGTGVGFGLLLALFAVLIIVFGKPTDS
jgi:hypothetical protein